MSIYCAGFTKAGVAAGSYAAAIQTPLTAKGSMFALLQSAGAKTTLLSPDLILLSAGTVGAIYYFSS